MRIRLDLRRVLIAACISVLLVLTAGLALAQSKRGRREKSRAKPVSPVAVVVPFHSGEKLDYRILFSKYAVNAAKVETSVVEERDFFGHLAWHFRAVAHTQDTTRMLLPIDDQFDSYTAALNLVSIQYEMYLHEQGKEQTSLYRLMSGNDPAPRDTTAVRVAPGTRDAISFLYTLRAADWQHTPELRAPVFDGHRLYDAVARIDTPQGNITVPAGTFSAYRVAIHLFDHGKEVSDTQLRVWLAKDAAHTPVLAEADVPFGNARIELTGRS